MFKLCALVSSPLIGLAGPASDGQALPLKAESRLTQTSVKNNELFSVSTAIRNTSGKEQPLVAWDCSYSRQWITDSLSVRSEGEPCLQNVLSKVKLRPGASYKKNVQALVTLPAGSAPTEVITFRLGFESEKDPMAPPSASHAAANPRLWSNAVTVTVTK